MRIKTADLSTEIPIPTLLVSALLKALPPDRYAQLQELLMQHELSFYEKLEHCKRLYARYFSLPVFMLEEATEAELKRLVELGPTAYERYRQGLKRFRKVKSFQFRIRLKAAA